VADAGNADAIKAVASAVLDDDVIEATFKARHLQVFDDPTIAGKVGEYVQKAKTATGELVVKTGGENELLRVVPKAGQACTVGGSAGAQTVDDVAVLLRGYGGSGGVGKVHIFERHVSGTEGLMDAPQTTFWPMGQTVHAPVPVSSGPSSITLPAGMTEAELLDVTIKGTVDPAAGTRFGIAGLNCPVGTVSPSKLGQVITAYPTQGTDLLRWNRDLARFQKLNPTTATWEDLP
jgi:hypothetical protein